MKHNITDITVNTHANDCGGISLWITITRGDSIDNIRNYPIFPFQKRRSYRLQYARAVSMQGVMLIEAILARTTPAAEDAAPLVFANGDVDEMPRAGSGMGDVEELEF